MNRNAAKTTKIFIIALWGFVCSITVSAAVFAQGNGTVSGQILDRNQLPVEGALIFVEQLGLKTTTASDGRYRFGAVAAGNYTLVVDYLGQEEFKKEISVVAGETTQADIQFGGDFQLEELIVTAVAQKNALNKERAADNFKTVVASDAIAGFPDYNVAESLSRLPGLSVDRSEGEGTEVIVRGLGTEFNQVTLEGATIPNTQSGNSGLELDILPSDILEDVEVSKTLTPDMDGDSIGGRIRLRALNAFDRGGFSARIRIEANEFELRKEVSPKISGSWTDVFESDALGELGLAVSYSSFDRQMALDQLRADRGFEIRDLTPGPGFGTDLPQSSLGEPNTGIFPGEIEQRVQLMDRTRESLGFNVDWRPSANTEYRMRFMATDFDDVETRWRNEIELRRASGIDGIEVISGTTGVLDNVEIEKRIRIREFNQSIRSLSVGGTHHLGPWMIEYDIAASATEENNPFRYRLQFDDPSSGFDNVVYSFGSDGAAIGQLAPDASDRTDSIFAASSYVPDDFRNQRQLRDDEIEEFKIDIERELQWGGIPGAIKFGVKQRQRDKSSDESQIFYRNLDNTFNQTLADFNTRNLNYSFGQYVGPHITEESALQFIDTIINDAALTQAALQDIRTIIAEIDDDFSSMRDVSSAYIMGTFDFTGATRLVAGVRVEETDWQANAFQLVDEDSAVFNELQTIDNYSNVLPSINLRINISDNLLFRAGYYASLRRPNFNDKTPVASLVADDRDTLVLGNADLEPIEADSFDMGLAYYFGRKNVFQLGLFHKKLDNFFIDFTADPSLSGANTIFSVGQDFASIDVSDTDIDTVLQVLNGEEATVTGLELTYHQAYDFLPAPWSGLYLTANIALLDSEADYGPDIETVRSGDIELVEQSDIIANLQLGYEKGPWDIRLSGNLRGEFLDTVGTLAELDELQAELTIWDLGVTYRFSKTYRVYLNASNITDEENLEQRRGFANTGRIIRVNQLSGRSVALGFQARY